LATVAYLNGLRAAALGAGALTNPVLTLQRTHAAHGPIVALRLPSLKRGRRRQTILVADPLICRGVLQRPEQFNNVALYPIRGPQDSAQRRLRFGIIRVNGPRHDHQRAQLGPYLSRKVVTALESRVHEIARREVAAWPLTQRADLVALVNRVIRSIAFEVLFGEPDSAPGLAMAEVGGRHLAMTRSLSALAFPVDWPWTPYGQVLRRAQVVEDTLLAWIARRRAGPRGQDLMSMLLEATDETGAPISATDAAAQLWTLYGASFDTTSTTLAWVLLLLAQNPPAAQQLLNELAAAQGGEPPAFLSHIIKEAMRLCTPVPLQIRKVAQAGVLPETALEVWPGDHVILSDCVANRATTYFPDPQVFRPTRWADPSLPDAAALTFSAGPRGCVGYWFAMTALTAAISAIWPNVRIAVEPGARIDFRTLITLNPLGIPVRLHAQDGAFAAAPIRGAALRMSPALAGPPQEARQTKTQAPAIPELAKA
jgi:cytochrome P450